MQEMTSMQQDAENAKIPTSDSKTGTWASKSRLSLTLIVL